MERRSFVRQTFWATTGLLAIPFVHDELFAAASTTKLVDFSAPVSHVRHGLLSDQLFQHAALPKWMKVGEPQRMFRNGFSSQPDDLLIQHFALDDSRFSVHRIGTKFMLFTTDGCIELGANDIEIQVNERFQLNYQCCAAVRPVKTQGPCTVLLLSGAAWMEGNTTLTEGTMAQLSATSHIIPQQGSKLLLIS